MFYYDFSYTRRNKLTILCYEIAHKLDKMKFLMLQNLLLIIVFLALSCYVLSTVITAFFHIEVSLCVGEHTIIIFLFTGYDFMVKSKYLIKVHVSASLVIQIRKSQLPRSGSKGSAELVAKP